MIILITDRCLSHINIDSFNKNKIKLKVIRNNLREYLLQKNCRIPWISFKYDIHNDYIYILM